MTSDPSATTAGKVMRIFHPTIETPDLPGAEAWFARVFGRDSIPLSAMLPSRPEYPTDYSIFTIIQDVMLDTIDPAKHFVSGKQRYPSVTRTALKTFGWYAEGMTDLYHRLRHNGVRSLNLWNEVVEGDEPPKSPPSGDVIVYFTVAEDTGLQYQFMREGPYPIDDRTKPGWVLPPVRADDALGVERCLSHVILTANVERALHFFVTVLGGAVVRDRAPNALLGGSGTLVSLAGDTFEFLEPDADSAAGRALAAKNGGDVYYSLTWKVVSLDRALEHLGANGVTIADRIDGAVITDPETSLGIPWIFTDRTPEI